MARTPEEIEDFNLGAQEFLSAVTSISEALKENAKAVKDTTGETLSRSIVQTSKAKKLAEEYKQLSQDALGSTKVRAKILGDIDNLTSIQTGIQAEINELLAIQESGAEGLSQLEYERLEHLKNAVEYFKGFRDIAEEVREEVEGINSQTEMFDNLADLTKQIPGIGVIFGEFGKASKAAGEAAAKGGNAMAAGAAQLTGAVGKLASAFAIGKILSGIKDGSQNITDLSRNLNISRDAADELNDRFNKLGRSIVGLTGADLRKATMDVSNFLGISAELSADTARSIGLMTKRLGLSAEEASKITSFTAGTNQELGDFTKNLIGTVQVQNAVTDSAVRYQDVLKDVSNAGAATQLTVSKFPGGLAKAAYEARKLGLNFSMLEKSAGSLLNFESSIEAELEAELLTGKELNLERARMAALTGDNATLAAELAKNFGTAQEFSKQNVLAQEAQAKAMGMTRQELAETLVNQEAMRNLGMDVSKDFKEQVKERQQLIDKERALGNVEKANRLEKQLYDNIGDSEFGRQEKNLSLMESQEELLTQIAESAQSIAKPFDHLSNLMTGLGTSAGSFLEFIGKIGIKFKYLGAIFGKVISKNIDGIFSSLKGFFPSLSKMLAKGGSKALLKKIPVVGALFGLGLGIKRMLGGDWLGGIMELTSGIASIFPGVGTAASIAVDGALLGMDAAGITGEKAQTVEGSLTTSALGTAMSSIGIAGGGLLSSVATSNLEKALEKSAKASEEAAKVMKEKELTVNMDGNKVGHSLALASSKSK